MQEIKKILLKSHHDTIFRILKKYITEKNSIVPVETVFTEFLAEHPDDDMSVNFVIRLLMEHEVIRLDYDIRYLTLGRLGRAHFKFVEYRPAPSKKSCLKLTIAAYNKSLASHCITEYDGIGYYGTDTQISDMPSHTEMPSSGLPAYTKQFTHVYWYNK